MADGNKAAQFSEISLSALSFSKSSAQALRRKHFDAGALKELAESIRVSGVAQPIVVRPLDDEGDGATKFEVVAGERRVLASRKAGLDVIPAMVRKLDDGQALDLQLVENLQREGLHELVECEGYEDLRKRGYSVEQIAEKVGKSTSYVYKRLELSACGPDLRTAFYEGKVDASKALLISRLPNDLQKKALKEITEENYYGVMSYRRALEHVRGHYMLRLDQAPFNTEDSGLVTKAGACGSCPKNTAQQATLFGDVSKSAALCTDGACFNAKKAAHVDAQIADAKLKGLKVITGEAAKELLPYPHLREPSSNAAFISPKATHPQDMKSRTFGELAGKGVKHAILISPHTGEAIKVLAREDVKAAIKEKGIKLRPDAPRSNGASSRVSKDDPAAAKQRAQDDLDAKILLAVGKAIYAKAPKPFSREELYQLADMAADNSCYEEPFQQITGSASYPNIHKLNDAGLQRLIRISLLTNHIVEGDKKVVFAEAKRHGVDVEKIKAELAAPKAAAPAKAKAKKAAKKK